MSTVATGSQDRAAVDLSLLVVRVIVGSHLCRPRAQKLFGAFGGPGLAAMVQPNRRTAWGCSAIPSRSVNSSAVWG